ncbi:peptidase [Mycolicibacterium sp. P1-18]|uniref:neutral zinc metallopeptidase n=1 Tax=Mycolicibacterium sp. P1-18 TaxID=2024615 RepID=UPI0011F3AF4A|nr:neutral zinc metallopeptidase [Mycolicibacterium sp. P1-18]KAA0100058.1 peptidase [Mycolicibacterium sp. P1-18]
MTSRDITASRRHRSFRTASLTCAAVVLVAGCGGGSGGGATTEAASPAAKKPDTSSVTIEGDASTPVNKLAIEAIADLQKFWADKYPKLYDQDYKPVDGGLYALTPDSESGPACASSYDDVAGNAFYCKLDDSVAWDSTGLLPDLQKKYGDFVIPIVLAHEFGHAVQQRSGFFDQNDMTVSSELQADCFAGGWSRHAADEKVFTVDGAGLDKALAGILDLRDSPGTNVQDPSAHGSGFDRVSAFQDGFDNGVEKCKGYRDGEPIPLELPFNDAADEASGGEAPYDTIANGVPYDLEDYWSQVFPELTDGQAWTPLAPQQAFDPSSPPDCGGQSAEGYALFYCVPDDYVGWDNADAMPAIYTEGGDYAFATLLATQWGLAALNRLGDDSDEMTSTARGDCLAGAYTASVILYNREATSSFHISPGDLDEGIKALLLFRGGGDVERQGAGFDRTRAYREGVIDGAQACLSYQA